MITVGALERIMFDSDDAAVVGRKTYYTRGLLVSPLLVWMSLVMVIHSC